MTPEQRHSLNNAVLSMAPGYHARPVAPGSFEELARAPRLVVWDGASDKTIFRDARVNHAFRAWHDMGHIVMRAPFSLAGEMSACQWQVSSLIRRWPLVPDWLLDIVRREVIGQATYYEEHGTFPEDQEAFHEGL